MFKIHGLNAHTTTTGAYGDIYNICKYGWYEWCYFCDNKNKSPFKKELLGRLLGTEKVEDNEMAQWILKNNRNVVPRRSRCPMKTEKVHYEQEQMKRKIFNVLIVMRWVTSINLPIIKGIEDSETGENEFK